MTELSTFDNLPVEVFVEILLKIDGCSLGRSRRVCKKWKECIDDIDLLWQEMCRKEFKYSSKLAKTKSGHDCSWYHIYKNLKLWTDPSSFQKFFTADDKLTKAFYKFTTYHRSHLLSIDYGLLPLKDSRGVLLFNMSTYRYIPVSIPEKNCVSISNNDYVTVVQNLNSIMVERTTQSPSFDTEAVFLADNYILTDNTLFFHHNKDIYKCHLLNERLASELVLQCDYNIKELQVSNGTIHIFTACGQIVNITKNKEVIVQPMRCPIEWIRQIKYISAINNRNFVCYSRNLFKIETDKYQHLYLEFPPITAIFFYVDVVLIGTRTGEILLYRLSSQKKASKPIFEKLAIFPEGKFAVQLDVCEQTTGPTILVTTHCELYLLDVIFFPNEQRPESRFHEHKLQMFKRLTKLKERLEKD